MNIIAAIILSIAIIYCSSHLGKIILASIVLLKSDSKISQKDVEEFVDKINKG